jgi:hypothetical protein
MHPSFLSRPVDNLFAHIYSHAGFDFDAAMEKMVIEINKANSSTRTYADIGAKHLEGASTLSFTLSLPETRSLADQLKSWKAAKMGGKPVVTGLTTATCEEDVQKALVSLIKWLLPKLGNLQPLSLHDTHTSGIGGHSDGKKAKIDLSLCTPGSESALWSNLVSVVELKASLNSKTDYNDCVGEVIDRCRHIFDTQTERKAVIAAVMDATSIDVLEVRQTETGQLHLAHTGRVDFCIDLASAGFQHLLRLLSAPPGRLGFIPLNIPTHLDIGGLRYSRFEVLRRGSPRRAELYKAHANADDGRGPVVVKVLPDACENVSELEHLQTLNKLNCPHVPAIVGSEGGQIIAMRPMGQSLMEESMDVVKRCMGEVCEAMIFAYEKCDRLLHRDLSIGNVMQYGGHGYLIDWQVACKEPACVPEDRLTGTPRFCGHLVGWKQHKHSLLDDLESVIFVVLHIFCNGHLPWKITFREEDLRTKKYAFLHGVEFLKHRCGEAEWALLRNLCAVITSERAAGVDVTAVNHVERMLRVARQFQKKKKKEFR